jgi:ribulose-5-phosphate 4-epimerase/fuculose-1-phosphate aldolase
MLANDPVTQARIDLAAALRSAARHGLNEGVCNHFSMTVPGCEALFLVNPQGLHWSEITPSDLVMADGAGNVIEGKYPVEASAFFIHGRLHAGNARAKVVLHSHMPYATALTSIRDGRLEMCTQNAFRYWNRIAYDEAYGGVALSAEEGDRMCRALRRQEHPVPAQPRRHRRGTHRRPGLRRPLLSRARGDGAGAGHADRPAIG